MKEPIDGDWKCRTSSLTKVPFYGAGDGRFVQEGMGWMNGSMVWIVLQSKPRIAQDRGGVGFAILSRLMGPWTEVQRDRGCCAKLEAHQMRGRQVVR